mgnify:CR=1 FL=1
MVDARALHFADVDGESILTAIDDVCLSSGRFLDGTTVADLPRPVEVVPTDGAALRAALGLPLPASPTPA